MGKLVKDFIEMALIVLALAAVLAGASTIVWIWAVLIYPPFDLWLAVKVTFWSSLGVGLVYGIADMAEHHG